VASQDCDLNDWETTRTEPLVELRARITADDPDTEWGIRSRVLLLTSTRVSELRFSSPPHLASCPRSDGTARGRDHPRKG
jgi:hypothetical protein